MIAGQGTKMEGTERSIGRHREAGGSIWDLKCTEGVRAVWIRVQKGAGGKP